MDLRMVYFAVIILLWSMMRAAAEAQRRAAAFESFFNYDARPSSAPKQRNPTSEAGFDAQFQNKGASDGLQRQSTVSSSTIRKTQSTVNIADDLASIFGGPTSSGDFEDVEGETEEIRGARLERHQKTLERTAKALAEKNERDMQVQRDQAERHRIAETLDVEIRRWAAGKEGNLRALLLTLQYMASSSQTKNLKWTFNQDAAFINFLVEEVKARRIVPGGFSSDAWNDVSNNMIGLYGSEFTRDKLKNRLKTLKKTYNTMKKLINESGFGWDEVAKKVFVNDQHVWDEYIKAHPDAASYRTKDFPDYVGLAIIFGDTIVDGRDSATNLGDSDDEDEESRATNEYDNGEGDDFESSTQPNQPYVPTKRIIPTRTPRSNVGIALVQVVETVGQVIVEVAKKQLPPRPGMRDCIEALNVFNLSNDAKWVAIKIMEDPVKATTFMALELQDRAWWLQYELQSYKP